MTITLTTLTASHPCHKPTPDSRFVIAPIPCPACGRNPVHVVGSRPVGRERVVARALCLGHDCGAEVGELVAEVETFFGLEEDELVFARVRVYGGGEFKEEVKSS